MVQLVDIVPSLKPVCTETYWSELEKARTRISIHTGHDYLAGKWSYIQIQFPSYVIPDLTFEITKTAG